MNFKKLILLFVFAFLPVAAYSADNDVSKSEFESLYAKMKAAMANRNREAILSLLAPDFISEDTAGNISNSEEMLKGLDHLPKDPNKTSSTVVLSVEKRSETAKVKQQYTMNTIKAMAGSEPKPVKLTSMSIDNWVKINGKWLLQKTVTQEMEYIVSGNVVMHTMHK